MTLLYQESDSQSLIWNALRGAQYIYKKIAIYATSLQVISRKFLQTKHVYYHASVYLNICFT